MIMLRETRQQNRAQVSSSVTPVKAAYGGRLGVFLYQGVQMGLALLQYPGSNVGDNVVVPRGQA